MGLADGFMWSAQIPTIMLALDFAPAMAAGILALLVASVVTLPLAARRLPHPVWPPQLARPLQAR